MNVTGTKAKTLTVTLPSGRRLRLEGSTPVSPLRRRRRAPLFSELFDVVAEGSLTLRGPDGATVDVADLPLADFHGLRAITTREGWLAEDTLDLTCRNCDGPLPARPCAALPLGPFLDGELADPELDVTLDLGVPHEVPPGLMVGPRTVTALRLAPRTAREARPLHRALRRRTFAITPAVVHAMGIEGALTSDGPDERTPGLLARALAEAPVEVWVAVEDLFLRAHYPPRLFAVILCPACGARNDVDAPYEREFEGALGAAPSPPGHASNEESFPEFDDFCAEVEAQKGPLFDELGVEVPLVVDAGTPACDDGGEPLLGSYVPGYEGDAHTPSRAPEVTLYFQTFRAMAREDGPYPWRAEVAETLRHELEHHLAHLRGTDPVDDDERESIREEAARVLGRRDLTRRQLRGAASDALGFWAKTWPLWLLVLLVTLVMILADSREATPVPPFDMGN